MRSPDCRSELFTIFEGRNVEKFRSLMSRSGDFWSSSQFSARMNSFKGWSRWQTPENALGGDREADAACPGSRKNSRSSCSRNRDNCVRGRIAKGRPNPYVRFTETGGICRDRMAPTFRDIESAEFRLTIMELLSCVAQNSTILVGTQKRIPSCASNTVD